MSTFVTYRPQSSPRPLRAVLAAGTWAVVGAAVAAGGWVAGLVLARSLMDVLLVGRDLPAGRFVEFAVPLAGIGSGWGLLAGLVAGLIRRQEDYLASRIAPGGIGAAGGAVFGLIGGGLIPVSMAVVGRTLPVELSTSLGWAFAGMLAGLVVYGWTQVREQPVASEDEPDEVAEPEVPPAGEGWPRSLVVAGKWAAGGAVAAAGAWTFGLLVGQSVMGIDVLSSPPKRKVEQVALSLSIGAAEAGGAIGLVVGLAVVALRGGGRFIDRGAMGAVGGALVGLTGGGLAPLLAGSLRGRLPVEVSSALGWAFVGALAGLVAYGWSRPKFERVEPPSRKGTRRLVPILGLAALAVAAAFAAVVGVLPDRGRWAAGGVALLAVAVLAVVVAAVVAAQDRRIRELERRMRELEWDDRA